MQYVDRIFIYIGGTIPLGKDYIIGHEPMGIVEEVGSAVKKVKKSDRVVIPFNVSCGECHFCKNHMESQCDNSNHTKTQVAILGFRKCLGIILVNKLNIYGSLSDFSSFVVPESSELDDESLLFLSDVIPTAYWSVENSGLNLEIQLLY